MTDVDLNLVTAAWMGGVAVRLMLVAILVHSAWHALRDVPMHAAIVEQYRLLPRPLVYSAALGLPILSVIAAIAMLFANTARSGLALALVLLLLFALAIGINLARGRTEIDCGCGGAEGQRLSSGLLARNITLCVLAAAAWLAPTTALAVDAAMLIGAVGAAAALVAFYFAVNQLLNNDSMFNAA